MAIAYRTNATAYYTAAGQTKTIVIPTSAVVGDLILLGYSGGNTLPDSIPAGFTLVSSSTGGTEYSAVYSKVCATGDPGATVTVVAATNAKTSLALVVYSGVSTSTPIAVSAAQPESTSGTTHAAPAMTLPGSYSGVIVQFLGVKDTTSASSSTYTPPSGYTARVTAAPPTGQTSPAISSFADTGSAVSAYSGGSWTVNAASANASVVSLALSPTSTSGTTVLFPTTDVTTGGWVSTDPSLAAAVDDEDAGSFITSPTGGGTFELGVFSLSAPPVDFPVDYVAASGTTSMSVTISLVQGSTVVVLATDTTLRTSLYRNAPTWASLSSGNKALFSFPGNFNLRVSVATT